MIKAFCNCIKYQKGRIVKSNDTSNVWLEIQAIDGKCIHCGCYAVYKKIKTNARVSQNNLTNERLDYQKQYSTALGFQVW